MTSTDSNGVPARDLSAPLVVPPARRPQPRQGTVGVGFHGAGGASQHGRCSSTERSSRGPLLSWLRQPCASMGCDG